jgi:hypothetical protein
MLRVTEPWKPQFTSLTRAPVEARHRLQLRLSLLKGRHHSNLSADVLDASVWGADLLLQRILEHGQLSQTELRSVAGGQSLLQQFNQANGTTLKWNEIVADGWLRVLLGDWWIPGYLSPEAHQPNSARPPQLALLAWLSEQILLDQELELTDVEALIDAHRSSHPETPSLGAFVEESLLRQSEDDTVYVLMPHTVWYAYAPRALARCWERRASEAQDRMSIIALARWWSRLLGLFNFDVIRVLEALTPWGERNLGYALTELRRAENDLLGWDAELRRLQTAFRVQHWRDGMVLGTLPPAPAESTSLLEKYFWLQLPAISTLDRRSDGRALLGALFSAQLRRTPTGDFGAAPHPTVAEFVRDGSERPHLIELLAQTTNANPELAADLLLIPESAGLALYLVSRPSFGGGGVGSALDDIATIEEHTNAMRAVWTAAIEFAVVRWALSNTGGDQLALVVSHLIGERAEPFWPAPLQRWLETRLDQLRIVIQTWDDGRFFDLASQSFLRTCLGDEDRIRDPADPNLRACAWFLAGAQMLRTSHLWRDASKSLVRLYWRSMLSVTYLRNSTPAQLHEFLDVAIALSELAPDSCRLWIEWPNNATVALRELVSAPPTSAGWQALRDWRARMRWHLHFQALLVGRKHEFAAGFHEILEVAFEGLLASCLQHDPKAGELNVFDGEDVGPLSGVPFGESPLPQALGLALDNLTDTRRDRVLDRLVEYNPSVRLLAELLLSVRQPGSRERLLPVVKKLSPSDIGLSWTAEVQHFVEALLRSGFEDKAELILNNWEKSNDSQPRTGWGQWAIGIRLRLLFARERYEDIRQFELPAQLSQDHQVQTTLRFYQGIALLQAKTVDGAQSAVGIFEQLHSREPYVQAYSVNLFAAHAAEALYRTPDVGELNSDQRRLVEAALRAGESLWREMGDVASLNTRASFGISRCLLLARLGLWDAVLAEYHAIPTSHRGGEMLQRMVINAFELTGGAELAEQHRKRSSLNSAAVSSPYALQTDEVTSIRNAICVLPSLVPAIQAQVYNHTLHRLVISQVNKALLQLRKLSPTLRAGWTEAAKDTTEATSEEENRITDHFVELLTARVQHLGWTVHDQCRGGYTGLKSGSQKGGVGSRDVCLKSGEFTLAIMEAVNVRPSFNTTELRKHFQKLIPYASESVNLFVMLLWGFHGEPDVSWDKYMGLITNGESWLANFPLAGQRGSKHPMSSADLPFHMTIHGGVGGPHHIVHFYVDLAQVKKREAAAAARHGE